MGSEGNIICDRHVVLRCVELKAGQEQAISGEGLLFIFPGSGGGEWRRGTRAQPLAPGEVFLMNAQGQGILRADGVETLSFHCFSLGFEHLGALCAPHELGRLENIMERLRQPRIYPAQTSVAQTCDRLLGKVPAEANLEHRSLLLRIAGSVLFEEFKEGASRRALFLRAEERFVRVLEKLSVSDLINMSVDELALAFSCSRRQLNRKVQNYFGKSPRALRMEIRLLHAATLLRNSEAKVINVAEECGFNHLGLFNTSFKRRFGACPSEWRRQPAENADRRGKPPGKAHRLPSEANIAQACESEIGMAFVVPYDHDGTAAG